MPERRGAPSKPAVKAAQWGKEREREVEGRLPSLGEGLHARPLNCE